MAKPQNIESIEKATKRNWDKWVQWLDERDARDMTHSEIAAMLTPELLDKVDNAGWWGQGITVAYEQHIGRRKPGQRSDGTFEAAATKTRQGSRDAIFGQLGEYLDAQKELRGLAISDARTSVTPVRSYWKCNLSDGTKVTVAIESKSTDKSMISIVVGNIQNQAEATAWKAFWQDFFELF